MGLIMILTIRYLAHAKFSRGRWGDISPLKFG